MNALRSETAALRPAFRATAPLAREPEHPWEARGLTDLVPPATLAEARARRDELARLLGRERVATADFLLALADFDRRRGWERLGHASLFAFLSRELGLSNGAAWSRSSAARLLPRHSAVEAALRDGRLCLSAVGELARVLTAENEAEVLPRFFGCSSREARAVAAAIRPNPNPPRRDVVSVVPAGPQRRAAAISPEAIFPKAMLPGAMAPMASGEPAGTGVEVAQAPGPARQAPVAEVGLPGFPLPPPPPTPAAEAAPVLNSPTTPLRAHEVALTHPAGVRDDEVEPLTADLRRLRVTVSARLLEKLARARTGLSHTMPRASTEQVLEAALDLLLEKQARRTALVKRPRKPTTTTTSTPMSTSTSTPNGTLSGSSSAPATPAPSSRSIPAEIEREVRLRDGGRCQFPLDGGGVCGSTWRIQIDHIKPLALGGPTTVMNLRCACAFHNRYAAELALGPAVACVRRRRER